MSGEHGCARCAEYAAEIARMRKLFDDAGQEAAEKRAAERKLNSELQGLLNVTHLALARERDRNFELTAENDHLLATLRAAPWLRVPGSET